MLVDLFDKMFVRYGEQSSVSADMSAAVDMLKSEARAIQLMYQNALKSTESVQGETIETGLQEGVYNKKQSVEKNGDVFYNKDEYWHTDLTKRELKMLEGWIQRAGFPEHTKITDTANWYKGRLNGEPIFAIYSSVYHNNSTILYEKRGADSLKELDVLIMALEVIENETSAIRRQSIINGILEGNWVQKKRSMANNDAGPRRRGSNTGYAPVLQGKPPKFIGSKAFRNVVKNIFGIQEKSETEISTNNVLKSKKDVGNNQTTGYNKNTDQYRVMWTIEEGVMNNSEVSQFYDLVGEVKRGMKFPKTFEGETILEVENKLIYADTDYFYPSISKVIEIKGLDEEFTADCKEMILSGETEGIENTENIEFAEIVYGQGTVTSTDFIDSKAYRREKDGRRKRSGSGTPNSRSGKDVLKSKTYTETYADLDVSAPTFRTTAQIRQSAFELREGTKAEMHSAMKEWHSKQDFVKGEGKYITEGLAPMSHEKADSLIAETQSEDTVSSQGRIGAKVISQAYDVNDENSLISRIMEDGYNESEASKIVDGIYSFMYARGRDGANLEDSLRAVESNLRPGVSEQAKVFYDAGVEDSQNLKKGKRKARLISNQTVARLLKEKKIDHRTIRAINAIAKKLGIDIEFADDVDGEGEFNTETLSLRINANAKNRFFITSVHESIHALRTIDPESYNKISDIVYEVLSIDASKYGKAWNEVLNRYRKEATDENGRLNKDYIREELNAKVISELLADPRFIKELAKQNRNLALRVVDMIVDLFDKMFVRYGEQSSASVDMRAAVDMLKSEARAIQLMYQNALKSTESVQTEKITSAGDGEVMKSKVITVEDVKRIQSIGRKSINDLTKDELEFLESVAQKYYKEMGVKSPFFRRWFGDWRAEEKNPVKVLDIKPGNINKSTRTLLNNDISRKIKIESQVFSDSIHYAQQYKDVNAIKSLLSNIDKVVSESILLHSKTSEKNKSSKKGNTMMMHHFYIPVEYNKAPFIAELIVEEYLNNNSDTTLRAYNVQRIKMSELARGHFNALTNANKTENLRLKSDEITISDLFKLVKTYDKDFNPKPCSLVLNEDGTPKETYHGTADIIKVFQKDKRGSNTGAPSSKKAFFFTDSKNVAIGYAIDARPEKINELYKKAERLENQAFYNGKYAEAERAWEEYESAELEYNGIGEVMPIYLQMKNPLVYDFHGKEYRETTYNELIQKAIKNKNDGVIFKNTYDGSNKNYDEVCTVYAVFDSNQIKSVENGGTFSSWDDNIYKSKNDVELDSGIEYNKNGIRLFDEEYASVNGVINDMWRRDSKDLDKYHTVTLEYDYQLYMYVYKAYEYDKHSIVLKIPLEETDDTVDKMITEVLKNESNRIDHIINSVIRFLRNRKGTYRSIDALIKNRGTQVYDVGVPDSESQNIRGRSYGDGNKNSRGNKGKLRSGKDVLKSKFDTETDADIEVSAPTFRTTAQIRQSAFELREETKKKLESQVKKYEPKSYGGADFDFSKITKKIYNARAWAYTLFSNEDLSLLKEKYYEYFMTNIHSLSKLSDKKTRVLEINNKLIFARGTYSNPVIEAVLIFNTDNATDMEILKNLLFIDAKDDNYSKYGIRRIKNEIQIFEGYGQTETFDFYERTDYTTEVEGKGWGAKIEDDRKAFGYNGVFTVRDGIYRKDNRVERVNSIVDDDALVGDKIFVEYLFCSW